MEKNTNYPYFSLLGEKYPTKSKALSRAAVLAGELNMPKPTEHFVSDLHGEMNSFSHVMRNASGLLRNYVLELFPEKSKEEQALLSTTLYYPEEKLALLKENREEGEYRALTEALLLDVLVVTKRVAAKYDLRKLRTFFPEGTEQVLDSLLSHDFIQRHKEPYLTAILAEVAENGQVEELIIDLSNIANRCVLETIHVIGDIYDRGEEAEEIIDFLMAHPDVDIQYGNHDILWVGAAAGSFPLIANVIRIATRYNSLSTLEDGYGINLAPLVQHALKHYDYSEAFVPKVVDSSEVRRDLLTKMHKAITVLQFKAESEVIERNPDFQMESMLHFHHMDREKGTVKIGEREYPLKDKDFPTMDPKDPYAISREEREIIDRLVKSFTTSEKLNRHLRFLIEAGSMYKITNENILFHGCIPMTEAGLFKESTFMGKSLRGRALLDAFDEVIDTAYYEKNRKRRERALDLLFYLWCGKDSPLFGKDQITTFERYLIADKSTHVERKNPYYRLREREDIARYILREFDMDEEQGRIINGHTPVKRDNGEKPVKAGGKVLVIDGGFNPTYRKTTGTAGYTLISNSYGILLVTHKPFPSEEKMIAENSDVISSLEYIEEYDQRRLVKDTERGREILREIEELKTLANLYDRGILAELN